MKPGCFNCQSSFAMTQATPCARPRANNSGRNRTVMPSLLPIGGTIRLNASSGGAATVVPLAAGGFATVYRVANGPDVFNLYDDSFNLLTGEIPITTDDF